MLVFLLLFVSLSIANERLELQPLVPSSDMQFLSLDEEIKSIQVNGHQDLWGLKSAKLVGRMINHNRPMVVTHKLYLGNSVWLVGLIDGPWLKIVKIEIISYVSYRWLGTRYNQPTAECKIPALFTTLCYTGHDPKKDNYPVNFYTAGNVVNLGYVSNKQLPSAYEGMFNIAVSSHGWEFKSGGIALETRLGVVTHKLYLGDSIWLVGVIVDTKLLMMKIQIFEEDRFRWIGTKYDTDGVTAECLKPLLFTTACYTGTSKSAGFATLQIAAVCSLKPCPGEKLYGSLLNLKGHKVKGNVGSWGNDKPISKGNIGKSVSLPWSKCGHFTGYSVSPAYWGVDLGEKMALFYIKLYNRDDCCQGRLTGIKIYFGDSWDSFKKNTLIHSNVSVPKNQPLQLMMDSKISGQYLWVERDVKQMTLCEIQVFKLS